MLKRFVRHEMKKHDVRHTEKAKLEEVDGKKR